MATVIAESGPRDGEDILPEPGHERRLSPAELSMRRFKIACAVGAAVVLPIYLWAMWAPWSGSVNVLRAVPYSYFYDLQARALFHGHLYLPDGKMGIEAFVHNGRDYTYFGLFPSIIRMPILLVTSRLDGQMTAPSILLAWLATAVICPITFWRLRILMRGSALMGRAEAAAYGVLMATILGGSVILYLGATPFVFSEDFAWSIPLTVASLFALLGVLERPSRGRVIASGVLILCASLNRSPPGWACSITALLIAGWFALGREGPERRRWVLPLVATGILPFLATCVVTYAKFGIPVGLPMADQVWAHVNYHRRYFLAVNGGKAFNFAFLPSTLAAYFQPFGVRLSGIFPFISPPGAPAPWLAGATLDQSYPTASFTDISPLLLVLSIWGVVTAFRPRGIGQVRLTRIILLGAAAGAGGVLLWGYISQRYLGDLMPFAIIACGIGLIDVCRRMESRTERAKGIFLGAITAAGVYCIAANLAITVFPVAQWTMSQSQRFISAENALSIDSVGARVHHGSVLPYWAPAGTIFDVGHCAGLYLSTGNDMKDVPGQQIEHYTWLPVEQPVSDIRVVGFTFNRPVQDFTEPVTLMTYGKSRLVLEPAGAGNVRLHLYDAGTAVKWPLTTGWKFPVPASVLHEEFRVVVTVDPILNRFIVNWYNDQIMINHYVAGHGPAIVTPTKLAPGATTPAVTVVEIPLRTAVSQYYSASLAAVGKPQMPLCRSLSRTH